MTKNPVPQGNYVPATRSGNLIFTAGMTPRKDGVLMMSGKVNASDDLSLYRNAVRQAAQNALTAAQNMLQDGERISCLLTVTVFVNAEEGYTAHARFADLVSEYYHEVLGKAGIAARASIGVASLPGNAPCEIQIIAAAE